MSAQTQTWQHRTVLLHEAVEGLVHRPDGTYLDCTFGRGGHSRLILEHLSPAGRLIAIDRDPEAIAHAMQGEAAIQDARFSIAHARFAEFPQVLAERGVTQLDGILLDLGVSSPQIDNPERGFSFRNDGPLDMRMDPSRGRSAAEFLATATQREIAEVLRDYGEERFAPAIAKAVIARRETGPAIERTAQLATLVAGTVKTRERGQDPATRTFQALRILVNAELQELEQGLSAAMSWLAPAARLAVISFHSLEDRIVKNFIAQQGEGQVDRRVPMAQPRAALLEMVARIKPSDEEVSGNPRSRSAILRVAERTTAPVPVVAGKPGRRAV